MSEIKALEALREMVKTVAADCDEGWILDGLDAIDHEVSGSCMRLPVDADGEVIHIGDVLLKSTGAPKASYGEVVAVSPDSVWFAYEKSSYESNWASLTRHVAPRTLEDVLGDFASRVLNSGHQWGLDAHDAIAAAADEIRGLEDDGKGGD